MSERPILFSAPMATRFMALVSPEPNTGCWLWLGSVNKKGYGRFGRGEMAHRAALRIAGVRVPDRMEVDHRCRVRCCVNPDHLDVVTHQENISRKPVPPTCPAGHVSFSIRNGKRACRQCGNKRAFLAYKPRGATRRRRPHLSESEKAEIASLIANGMPHSAIAALTNVSVATVSRVRNAR